jgi:hypothetical protein
MFPFPSLRAQRGNPYFVAANGLPRRSAPRNDGALRAFATSRETTFLCPHAKPRRNWEFSV